MGQDQRRSGGNGGFRSRNNGGHDSRRAGNAKSGGSRRSFNGGSGKRHFDHRDGERKFERRDGERKFERHDGDRKFEHRDGERKFQRHDSDRKFDRRKGERKSYDRQERTEYHERKRQEYLSGPRKNSDGTMSFPSQNPYTHRRPNEPVMPKGMEWSMLAREEKERLRGLSKEHAENIGLHILAAYTLEPTDPERALEHAKWIAKQASRIDFARETLAFVAYRMGDYKLAAREFRTAMRMNGYVDYLPFIADCERGMGQPRKAIDIALSDESRALQGEAKVEMFLVYAGALADLERFDTAIEIVHKIARSKGLPGEYRMRALQAEQYFLEQSGQGERAADLDPMLERLEAQYADQDEDDEEVIVDYDLHSFTDDQLEELGIDESEAQFAPADQDAQENENTEQSEESEQSEKSEQDEQTEQSVESEETDEVDEAQNDIEKTAESASEEPEA